MYYHKYFLINHRPIYLTNITTKYAYCILIKLVKAMWQRPRGKRPGEQLMMGLKTEGQKASNKTENIVQITPTP